jgi:hypothetical protein
MYMFDLKVDLASPIGRRGFLNRMAAAGLGAAAVSLIGCGSTQESIPGTGVDTNANGGTTNYYDAANFPGISGNSENAVVLNFALTLEYLEADLYRQALNFASGRSLDTALDSAPGGYSLAIGTSLDSASAAAGFAYLQQFAYVEAAHRDFLIAAVQSLGDTPVSGNANGYQADFGTTLESALTAILGLEEEGVRAYLGAAGFLTDLGLVQIAASIYSTEARHSAALHAVLGQNVGPAPMANDLKVTPTYPHPDTFEYYQTPAVVLQVASAYFVS